MLIANEKFMSFMSNEHVTPNPMNKMKTVMKIVVMLVIAGSNFALAENRVDLTDGAQLIACAEDDSSLIKVITQNQFEGIDPISIKVNQQLIIPLHYKPSILSNDPIPFCSFPNNEGCMKVTCAGATVSNTGAIDVNIICTALKPGEATLTLGQPGTSQKTISIEITE